jgi:hypothetical protein
MCDALAINCCIEVCSDCNTEERSTGGEREAIS